MTLDNLPTSPIMELTTLSSTCCNNLICAWIVVKKYSTTVIRGEAAGDGCQHIYYILTCWLPETQAICLSEQCLWLFLKELFLGLWCPLPSSPYTLLTSSSTLVHVTHRNSCAILLLLDVWEMEYEGLQGTGGQLCGAG